MVKKVYEGTIESTMVGPLYARAKYGALYPEIMRDPYAEGMYDKVKEIYSDKQEEFFIFGGMSNEVRSGFEHRSRLSARWGAKELHPIRSIFKGYGKEGFKLRRKGTENPGESLFVLL